MAKPDIDTFVLPKVAIAARFSSVVVASVLIVAAGLSLAKVPYGRAIWDFLFVTDGVYRISLGQVPHQDFLSPIGPLTLYLTNVSQLFSPDTNLYAGLHVMAWVTTIPVMLLLAPRFRSLWSCLGAVALLGLIMLVPVTVDDTMLSEISYFASYNRFASGYLFLLGLWLVLPKARHDWLLLGYILIILFFLKITACVVAIAVIAAALALRFRSIKQAFCAILTFVVVLVGMELTTRGFVSAYLGDIYAMSQINAGGGLHNLFFAVFKSWLTIVMCAILLSYLLYVAISERGTNESHVHRIFGLLWRDDGFVFIAALLLGASLLAESQNSGGIGLVSALALLFHPAIWSGRATRIVLVSFVVASIVLPISNIAFKRMLTVVIRETRETVPHPVNELFPGTTVYALTVTASRLFKRLNAEWPDFIRRLEADGYQLEMDPSSNAPGAMLAWIDSAVDAARIFRERNYGVGSTTYTTIAFADPFARMLQLTPSLGTHLVMDIGRTTKVMDEEDAAAYLSTSDGVFFSRCERRTLANNDAAFEAVFAKSFEKLPLNECWNFYRRVRN